MPVPPRHRLRFTGRTRWRGVALLLALVPGLIAEGTLGGPGIAKAPLEGLTVRPPLPAPELHEQLPEYLVDGQHVPRIDPTVHTGIRHHGQLRAQRQAVPGSLPPAPAPAPAVVVAPEPAPLPPDPAAIAAPAEAPGSTTTAAPSDVAPASSVASPVWLDVVLNQQHPGTTLFLQDADGHLWARVADLKAWRLPIPPGEALTESGEAYYPLDGLRGLHYQVDEAGQTVSIAAPAGLFAETAIDQQRSRTAAPDHSLPGGFLNYDLIVARASGDTAEVRTEIGGLFEVGTFNRWGMGTTTFARPIAITDQSLIRLDTTWTQDRPDALASVRIGDSISGMSSWSGAVHFGGVQWSTDFTTQPGFITTPLAGIRGEAVLPSMVDLYINDALRLQTSVPPGPFAINGLPVISGQGEARIVIRDVLGQQQLITVPYYTSPSLLRPGLSSFSYEVGVARDNYGLASNDYGRSLAAGTQRYGFNDTFTGELHAELLRDQQTIGVGGVWLAYDFAVLNAAVGESHSARGEAPMLQVGMERDSHTFSFGASARFASEKYVQLGMLSTELAPVRVLQGFFSLPMPARGSLGVNYIQQDYRDRTPVHLVSTQASWPVGHSGFLSFTAMKPIRGGGSTLGGATIGVNLIFSLGSRTSIGTGASRQSGTSQEQIQMQQNLPAGRGFGYRVAVGAGTADTWDATLNYQTDYGTYALHSVRVDNQSSYSAGAQGGIAVFDEEFFLSRRLDQSFAVVRVGDYPNVHVYADNQEVAVTDATGTALVPHIRAYERNPLSIEQADLPLDVEFGALQKDAVPYRRSGVLVDFEVKRSAGALLSLVREDGSPVPVGAVAQIDGNGEEFPLGMHGEAYVTGLSGSSLVRVTGAGQDCEIKVAFVPSADPLPKLGPYVCRGVRQ